MRHIPRKTVYIVDDDADVLEMNCLAFGDKGCVVVSDMSYDAAIERLLFFQEKQIRLDMAIVDLNLKDKDPNKTGAALAEIIKETMPQTKVVILTGYGPKIENSSIPVIKKGSFNPLDIAEVAEKSWLCKAREEMFKKEQEIRRKSIAEASQRARRESILKRVDAQKAKKEYAAFAIKTRNEKIEPKYNELFECANKFARKNIWKDIKYIAKINKYNLSVWELRSFWKVWKKRNPKAS